MGEAVAVVDIGRGNLLSVCNALEYTGAKVTVCERPDDMAGADRIVVPGVGSFGDGMRSLGTRGFVGPLEQARADGRPILGICLGMQLFAALGHEGGDTPGLAWFDAEVVRLPAVGLRIPHVGWHDTSIRADSPLFKGLPEVPDFYYLHSYHLVPKDPEVVDASCDYGGTVVAAVRHDNVAAVQFHPEKSQDYGLALLENFSAWQPC